MIPTETDDKIVGKKKTILKKIFVFEFFNKNVAKINANPVWKITTTNINRKLFPSAFLNKSSSVSKYVIFRRPVNSGLVIPSHF